MRAVRALHCFAASPNCVWSRRLHIILFIYNSRLLWVRRGETESWYTLTSGLFFHGRDLHHYGHQHLNTLSSAQIVYINVQVRSTRLNDVVYARKPWRHIIAIINKRRVASRPHDDKQRGTPPAKTRTTRVHKQVAREVPGQKTPRIRGSPHASPPRTRRGDRPPCKHGGRRESDQRRTRPSG